MIASKLRGGIVTLTCLGGFGGIGRGYRNEARTMPLLLSLYAAVTLYVQQNAERLALSPRRAT